MLSAQTWKYSSLRFVCFIMKCAGYVWREDALSFVFLMFTVSKFPKVKKLKIKVKSEVFPLENFYTHIGISSPQGIEGQFIGR